MPLYEYKCRSCGKQTDAFFKVADKPEAIPCECGHMAGKILSPGLVIGDDMPPWMRHEHVQGCVRNAFDRPITTRSEYKAHLKRKGIAEISAGREI
jgi:putative FmdB family regulatory protein